MAVSTPLYFSSYQLTNKVLYRLPFVAIVFGLVSFVEWTLVWFAVRSAHKQGYRRGNHFTGTEGGARESVDGSGRLSRIGTRDSASVPLMVSPSVMTHSTSYIASSPVSNLSGFQNYPVGSSANTSHPYPSNASVASLPSISSHSVNIPNQYPPSQSMPEYRQSYAPGIPTGQDHGGQNSGAYDPWIPSGPPRY